MYHLIDDLLALSRLGRMQVKKSVVNLNAMARQVFDRLQAEAPERDLQLTQGYLPQPWAISLCSIRSCRI